MKAERATRIPRPTHLNDPRGQDVETTPHSGHAGGSSEGVTTGTTRPPSASTSTCSTVRPSKPSRCVAPTST